MSDSEVGSSRRVITEPEPKVDNSPLQVVLTVGDRDDLLEMMSVLNETQISVKTEDISKLTLNEPESVSLDLSKLTDKQRRTVEIALQTGYYKQPRDADLSDLADQIGVSKSAVSQRLRTAEAKLVKDAFGGYR